MPSGLLGAMAEIRGSSETSERASRELRLAGEGDDETRLAALEGLLGELESELERDVGQTGAPRR